MSTKGAATSDGSALDMTISQSGPITRHYVGQRLSEIAIHNGTVYLAGQVPENNPQGDMRTQTTEVLDTFPTIPAVQEAEQILAEAENPEVTIPQEA